MNTDTDRATATDRDTATDRATFTATAWEADTVMDTVMDTERQTDFLRRVGWTEEPARRPRMPDPVRASAVRAGLIASVTLIEVMITILGALGGSWVTFPAVLATVASTIVATWAVLDVWVTQQVWNQRHGVVSDPRSTARELRRERRARRRAQRGGSHGRHLGHRPDLLSRA